MPSAKPLFKEDILRAMKVTRSNMEASRFLKVSYPHYRRYAKLYIDEETGKTLFDKHLNLTAIGIPKYHSKNGLNFSVEDILEGRIYKEIIPLPRIQDKLITEGYIEEKCSMCGFNEQRITDKRVPLVLNFKDGNDRNFQLNNISLVCYNCFFLYTQNQTHTNILKQLTQKVFELEKPVVDEKYSEEKFEDIKFHKVEENEWKDISEFDDDKLIVKY